jgi:hypothetical protein
VAEQERRLRHRLLAAGDSQVRGRVAGPAVVVAADQFDGQRRAGSPPGPQLVEERFGHPRPGVPQVAEDEQSFHPGAAEGGVEPGEVGADRADRDRDGGGPERLVLAQVQVGDDQGGGVRPEDGPLGQKMKRLAGDDGLGHSRSSSRVMRRTRSASFSELTASR